MTSGVKQPANTAAQVPTLTKTVVAFDATGFVQALSTCRDQGMETVPVFMQGVTVAAMATEAVDWDAQVQNLAHACRPPLQHSTRSLSVSLWLARTCKRARR